MFFTIDRITAGIATLLDDNDQSYNLPLSAIPCSVEEGELLVGSLADGTPTITGKDPAELAARMEARRAARRRRRDA